MEVLDQDVRLFAHAIIEVDITEDGFVRLCPFHCAMPCEEIVVCVVVCCVVHKLSNVAYMLEYFQELFYKKLSSL